MMYSVDPGNGHPCVARWTTEGQLDTCGEWRWEVVSPSAMLVVENQVIIPRFTKNPASIVKLCHWTGALAREFGWPLDETRVRWVLPRAWKGGTKKPKAAAQWAMYVIHQLVLRGLSYDELGAYELMLRGMPAGQRHDLADAVGLGLWHLGRLR